MDNLDLSSEGEEGPQQSRQRSSLALREQRSSLALREQRETQNVPN
jgi:hypothetical protein